VKPVSFHLVQPILLCNLSFNTMSWDISPRSGVIIHTIYSPEIGGYRRKAAHLFLKLHLPVELRAVCDHSTLKLESGSFVEDDHRQYFSDVLYSR